MTSSTIARSETRLRGSKLRAASSAVALHLAACLSLGSALIHLWAAPEHFSEWWGYGAVFMIIALAQGLYGVTLLRWPARPLYLLGVGGNLSIVALYVVTRTAGVPFAGPHAWHPEEVAALDLTATTAEVVLVVTLVWLARSLSVARTYLALGFALALASGFVLHLMQVPAHASQALGVAPHWLVYAALSTPLATLAVWVSTYAARVVISWFDPKSLPVTMAHRAAWALAASSAYAVLGATTGEFAGRYADAGTLAIQTARDAGVMLPVGFALLFAVASLRGAPWETPRRIVLWRPRVATVLAAGAASVALLAGPSLLDGGFASQAEAQSAPAAGCSASSYDRSYDVAAINVRVPYNRWGDLDPHGQLFVLQGDKKAVKNWSAPLGATPAEDPAGADNRRLRPRPLVIRANAGECVKVDFTNELDEVGGDGLPNDPRASMKVFGPSYDAQTSDGSAVGYNEDTTVSNNPGENEISYFWQAPDEEGMFIFRDQGATAGSEANSGSLAHGLFGAFVVEPAGSVWTDPESGDPLYAGDTDHSRVTKESGDPYIDSDIRSPGEPAFRETVQLSQDELPAGIGFGFNYGAEPQRNREANRGPDSIGEETSLSSWVYGDPALIKLASGEGPWKPRDPEDPNIEDCGLEEAPGGSCYVSNVARSYPGDPTKVRFANAGVKETHVFHMHAHQWLAEPEDVGNSGAPSGEITDANRPESTTIDSQTFGPGESFTAELLYGAGSKPGTFGDSIFHCHLYPHFADGFWSLFRVHDVLEDGSGKSPDGINVRRLVPLQDRAAPPAPTADNPGYPRFIPGKFGWRAPQPPDEISETNPNATDDPDTVGREDLEPATRTVAGRPLDAASLDPNDPVEADLAQRLSLEERVQNLNYTGDPNQQADVEAGAPFRNPCPTGSREVTYNVSVIQRDVVYNERGDHDTQGRILVLDKDVDRMLEKNPDGTYKYQPEPLFARVNAGDCVTWNLTNRLPNWIGNDAFQTLQQTNLIGQHIHLVKFDVLGSDGSSNGWNYQQAAFTRDQADFNQNLDANGDVENCDEATGCRLQNPPDWDPTTSSEGLRPGQTITERWFADYELRTVFTHDHHFAAVDQNRGLFGGLIVEPRGMDYRNPRTGEFYQPGSGSTPGAPTCVDAQGDERCEGTAAGEAMDVIGPNGNDDFREFGLAAQDFVPLTRAGGDPQNPDDVINPPAAPEAFPDDDPGTMAINYRNAPFQLRQEKNGRPVDPAYTFSSTVWGDPETPLLETYSEDPVRLRAIQGSQEEQHVLRVNGMRWREEPDDPQSPLVNSQDIGVSEAFNFEVPRIVCGPNDSACAGDYLYSSTTVDDMYLGMWGILRARGKQVPSLLPLPDNANPNEPTNTSAPTTTAPSPAGDPLTSTGLAPPEANAPGTPCPSGATIQKYNVVAMQTELEYNKYGDNDPYGLIYALADDEAAIRAGDKKPEPLVLRANEGDCIEVRLTNRLTPEFLEHNGIRDGDAEVPTEPPTGTPAGLRVSLSPQIVRYDVRGSDGTAVGYNRDQTVGPGDSKLYRWFADDAGQGEIGATNILDYGDARGHRHHGLFAGLMIEPRGATYHDPQTGEEIQSGASADIRVPGPDNDFREFSLFYQDGLNLRDSSGAIIEDPTAHPPTPGEPPEPPEAMDAEDQGEKGFNYANAPFTRRIGEIPATGMDGQTMSSVFSSTATSPLTGEAQGDPDTPIFRAFAGDDVRMRVLQGADKPRQNTFQVSGHSWRAQPDDPGSTTIGNQGGVSVGRAFNANLSSAAAPGDYLYGTGVHGSQLWGGLWGIMRLYPQTPLAESLNPTPIPNVDNPRAGGHPILPLEVSAGESAVSLRADPASVDAGGSTTLSGSLEIPGVGGLSGREVVIEQRPDGATEWQSAPDGTLTTGSGGSFTLDDASPSKSTDYRATFAGQPGIGIGGATSQPVRVEVRGGVSVGLSASAPVVVYGKTVTLSGGLASGDAPLSGERVVIEQKPRGAAGFVPVPGQPSGGVLTDGGGKFSLPGIRPVKSAEYRAVFAGGSGLAAAESAPVNIDVKTLVSVKTSAARVKVGKPIVISGEVSPAHAGEVRVTIRGGPRAVVKNVALANSRYALRHKPPRAGRYTVSVSFAGDADHLGNTSPARSFLAR